MAKRVLLSIGSLCTLNFFRTFSLKTEETFNSYYIWGNGYYQAIPGLSGTSFQNFTPKKVNISDSSITKLFLNEYFEGGITKNGDVLIWDTQRLASGESDPKDHERQNITKITSPDKSPVKEVHFTTGFLWILTSKGDVYQYPIDKQINNETQEIEIVKLTNKKNKINLGCFLQYNILNLKTGNDHFIALDESGKVYAMGDDTYGQCGLGANKRITAPPFYENRIRNPQQITSLPQIKKIRCGQNHTIAIGVEGGVYVWGSNSKMQLSQQQEYSKVDQPLIAVFSPIRLSQQMEQNNRVIDAAAGEEFTLLVTEHHATGETEVFGCGHNLRGELGAGFVRHLSDIVKVEGLSNYKINVYCLNINRTKTLNGEENIRIKMLECGKKHCMALLSIGAILEWGDNEYGQMGNKKRSTTENPIIMNTFSKEKVISIACGHNQSGVIIENIKRK